MGFTVYLEVDDIWEEVDNTVRREVLPTRRKRAIKFIRDDTYKNEKKRSLNVPKSFCAVCCRFLYEDETCIMSLEVEKAVVEFLLEKRMTWPVLMYKDPSGVAIGEVRRKAQVKRKKTQKEKDTDQEVISHIVVCASHRSSGNNSVQRIKDFVSSI